MFLIQTILPFLILLIQAQSQNYLFRQDLEKDLRILAREPVFVNGKVPSAIVGNRIKHDLKLFELAAAIDVSQGENSKVNYNTQRWQFADGKIKSIYQLETTIVTEVVYDEAYYKDNPPKEEKKESTYRAYAFMSTADSVQLYYLTDANLGLLEYRIGKRQVKISYPNQETGTGEGYIDNGIYNDLLREISK